MTPRQFEYQRHIDRERKYNKWYYHNVRKPKNDLALREKRIKELQELLKDSQ